ncbi:hypothetical protein Cch01nite_28130 [Cellulomonas chitinilytica]|uniref:Immunity protein Imm5 domain-containing protein n=1 Tax=Cellulomonas chitinilytica TaxID=398759 RepID=A0A919U3F2_9CELL|nr:Imm5 family immunity protein [Cellulomonas chitinilytica]GIG22089.1 hypothetical protein Cch01nite_28130 [Cellulomonas chitinilytica]
MTAPVDLPPTLVSGLVRAAAAIDADGELPAAARGRLHRLLEDAARRTHPEAGRYLRAKLAVTCAYAALPVLREHPGLHAEAERLTAAAAAVMRGELGTDVLADLHDEASARANGLFGTVDPRAVHALLACVAAVATVLYDPPLDELSVPEKEADPTVWESSFYASLAWTGGATWEGIGDPQVRARFWEWYLLVAVPFAWDVDSPLVPYPTEPPPL